MTYWCCYFFYPRVVVSRYRDPHLQVDKSIYIMHNLSQIKANIIANVVFISRACILQICTYYFLVLHSSIDLPITMITGLNTDTL